MKFTKFNLELYAAPLSKTEDDKCKHAIEAIKDALQNIGYTDDNKGVSLLESETLAYYVSLRDKYSPNRLKIFVQGSYANNTCVRNESDVDIAVVREDIYEYAFGSTFSSSSTNRIDEAKKLKDAVERALRNAFPYQVKRGNKSIKVDGNTYRKQSDVVPCVSMHYYYRSHLQDYVTHHDGVIIFADDGTIVKNFPKQHIINGKIKNKNTNYYYKKMVRIMKKMRYLMSDCGYNYANEVSSFGLESLVWNIPDSCFTQYVTYGFEFQEIINYLYSHKYEFPKYFEANGIKPLCPKQQDVDKYTAFIDKLKQFYQYDYS